MEEQTIWQKMNSSKFVFCAAAALASALETVASMIAGYPDLSKIGFVCTILAAGIYAFGRTFTDVAAIKANADTTQTVKTVTATTTTNKTVEKLAGINEA